MKENRIKKIFRDIRKYRGYALYAAKADLRTEVAGSYLNWVWWVLEPICMMFIYTLIFGVVFHMNEQYFPIFVFIGLTMWDVFSRGITNSVGNIKSNKAVVSKVYIPKYILYIEKMMVHAFKMFISFGIVIGMMVAYNVQISAKVLYFPFILIDLFMLTFAIGVHLQHFGVYVSDLKNITQIVLKMLFYMTGIFYDIETRIPGKWGWVLLNCNPMAFLLTAMRDVLLYMKAPSVSMLALIFFASLIIGYIGINRIYKYENSYAKVV